MTLLQKIFISILTISLCSCSNVQKNITDFNAISKNNGILVTTLKSNWKGHSNPLLAKIEYCFGDVTIKQSANYLRQTKENELKVISLPPGNYIWKFIKFGNYTNTLDWNHAFSIKKGEITYIGDIETKLNLKLLSMTGDTKVIDNSKNIKNKLNNLDQNLLKQHKLSIQITQIKSK
jgi:hypothetical protein